MQKAQLTAALAAADSMHVALIAMNEADGVFAVEFAGTPYAELKRTLIRTLALIGTEALDQGPDEAAADAVAIYEHMVTTGESIDSGFRHVAGAWSAISGPLTVDAGVRAFGGAR